MTGSRRVATPAQTLCHRMVTALLRGSMRRATSTHSESADERARGLTAPGGGDELSQLVDVDRRQSNQDGWEAVVVWLGEEFLLVGRKEHVLLEEVADAHRQNVRVGNPGLLGRDALKPDPREAFLLAAVANEKREKVFCRARSRQGHGDASDVLLVGHLRGGIPPPVP